jgi:hypothetical protein
MMVRMGLLGKVCAMALEHASETQSSETSSPRLAVMLISIVLQQFTS